MNNKYIKNKKQALTKNNLKIKAQLKVDIKKGL